MVAITDLINDDDDDTYKICLWNYWQPFWKLERQFVLMPS